MAKKRINVSVDESVHAEVTNRDDINVSGLVNSFLKEYLNGEETGKAAEKLRAERLEREANEKMEEAQSMMSQAEEIRRQFEKKEQEKEEKWKEAIHQTVSEYRNELRSVPGDWKDPEPSDKKAQFWADKIGITPKQFCEQWHDKRERYHDSDSDKGFQ